MISVAARVIGHEEIAVRLETAGARMRAALVRAVRQSAIEMQGIVKEQYLSGPRPAHLGVVTGRLRRSVNVQVTDSGASITGSVGTNVDYGRAWELGFDGTVQVRAHERRIITKNGSRSTLTKRGDLRKGAAVSGVASVRAHEREVHMAPRPFLAPALRDEAARFHERVRRAVMEGF